MNRAVTALALTWMMACSAVAFAQEKPAQTTIASFGDMVKWVAGSSANYKPDEKQKTIALGTKAGQLEGVMIIRWDDTDGVVQFIQTLPFEIPEARLPAMETAVTRVNHALSVPGFGVNHDHRIAYFRMTIPFQPRGSLASNEAQAYVFGTLNQASVFFVPLKKVALENGDPKGVLEHAKQEAKRLAEASKK